MAAFGYGLVDRLGQRSANAKKDSHYAINADEAQVIEAIFRKIGMEGMALRALARWLDDHTQGVSRKGRWEPKLLSVLIRNPVYKGEFAAHRYTYIKVPAAHQRPNQETKLVWKKIKRPDRMDYGAGPPDCVSRAVGNGEPDARQECADRTPECD